MRVHRLLHATAHVWGRDSVLLPPFRGLGFQLSSQPCAVGAFTHKAIPPAPHQYSFKTSLGISEKHQNELNEYFSFPSFWHAYLCVVCVLMCIHGHMCVGAHV